MPLYRGWSVVIACAIIAAFSWGLGFYGLGVYLHARGVRGPGLMGVLPDALGSYRTALWCLVALEAVAAASVLGGRARDADP